MRKNELKTCLARRKYMVSMATHIVILKNWGIHVVNIVKRITNLFRIK